MPTKKKAAPSEDEALPEGWVYGGTYANGDITASGPNRDGQTVEVKGKTKADLARAARRHT